MFCNTFLMRINLSFQAKPPRVQRSLAPPLHYSNGIDLTIDVPCYYEITPAPMTLTVNNAQREYGEPNPAFTYSITGFVNGETEQNIGVTPTFECEANKLSKAGDYRILASMNVPNYEVTYEYGTLSVLKAPITVSVANVSKVYGEKNPQFELSYSGLKNDEKTPSWSKKPTFKTVATEQSGAGQYEVNAEGGESPNYDVNCTPKVGRKKHNKEEKRNENEL